MAVVPAADPGDLSPLLPPCVTWYDRAERRFLDPCACLCERDAAFLAARLTLLCRLNEQPSLRSLGVVNAYGEAEYVGRNSQERTANIDNGTARIAENTLVETKRGDDLICPADGRVLLAEKLDGTAGNTIVIEHGAGVKSIFYCLNDIAVEAGDTVRQGETLGTTKDRTILEVRVGQVAVDPLTVLRNQSAALRS